MPNEIAHHIDRRADRVAAEIAAGGYSDELLSTTQIAAMSGLSIQWFEIGRVRGYGPPFIRCSPRRIRYRRGDYVAWLQERAHRSTSEYETAGSNGRAAGSRVVDGHVVPPEAA